MQFRRGGIRMAHLVLIFAVLALESFDPARCIDQLLFAGKERMAFGAYV